MDPPRNECSISLNQACYISSAVPLIHKDIITIPIINKNVMTNNRYSKKPFYSQPYRPFYLISVFLPLIHSYIRILTTIPVINENTMTNTKYSTNLLIPNTIFNAPRLVIFVAGPVSMNEAALPMLIPS